MVRANWCFVKSGKLGLAPELPAGTIPDNQQGGARDSSEPSPDSQGLVYPLVGQSVTPIVKSSQAHKTPSDHILYAIMTE